MTGRRPDSSASEAGLFMLCINMAPRSAVVVRVLSPALAQPWSCLRSLIQAPSAAPLVSNARRGTMAPRLDLELSLRASTSLDRPPTDERSLARPARRKKERDSPPKAGTHRLCKNRIELDANIACARFVRCSDLCVPGPMRRVYEPMCFAHSFMPFLHRIMLDYASQFYASCREGHRRALAYICVQFYAVFA